MTTDQEDGLKHARWRGKHKDPLLISVKLLTFCPSLVPQETESEVGIFMK